MRFRKNLTAGRNSCRDTERTATVTVRNAIHSVRRSSAGSAEASLQDILGNQGESYSGCAKILQLSSHYFNDLLKFESGKNIDEYFESKRLEMAKSMLLDSNNTVSVVTEKLGYPNIRYFSRLFKRITGVAPNNYRLSQN